MSEVRRGVVERSLQFEVGGRFRISDGDGGAAVLHPDLVILHNSHVTLPHSIVLGLDAGDLDPTVHVLVVSEVLQSASLCLEVGLQWVLLSVRRGPAARVDLGGGLTDQRHVALFLTDLEWN